MDLANEVVGRVAVRRMEGAGTDVARQPLQFVSTEQRASAGNLAGAINDPECPIDSVLFGAKQFGWPE